MICPSCTYYTDYNDLSNCPICGCDLDYLTLENINNYPWMLVYTSNDYIDAQMFKANLESADIPAHVLSQIDSTRQFTLGELSIVKIFVPSPLAVEAREIIDSIENSQNFE